MYLIDESRRRGAKMILLGIVAGMALLVLGWLAVATAGAAGYGGGGPGMKGGPGFCHGTYLIDFDSSTAIWTFSADRTVQATDSQEASLQFSHQQGAWRPIGYQMIKAALLDFDFDDEVIARSDAEIEFDKQCQNLSGTLDLRFYDYPTEDPLIPGGGELVDEAASFTGRRLEP